VLADFRRNSVRAVDDALAVGNLVFAVDENRTLAPQFLDHEAVVDNLFAHIDGRAEGLERNANHVDRPYHARAKPARLEQE